MLPSGDMASSYYPLSPTSTVCGSENSREPKKLVLCFDGTGNQFSGSNADTNVVKLLNKLDRNEPNQFHYYQTGIGTYDINETSVHKTWFGEMCSSISQTIDQGIGTTFDAHVLAAYRFLMRYYDSGDKIYMFGFSRGAFTAKFLARMIHTVGLLCKGNEEMVPFAYRLYQRYLKGETQENNRHHPRPRRDRGEKDDDLSDDEAEFSTKDGGAAAADYHHRPWHHHGRRPGFARDEITAFSDTFCRKEQVQHPGWVEERNIKVYFLGIWDCVNSVSVLERSTPVPVPIKGTARYVRHAVGVDERRVKFKPALLAQDIRASDKADVKEDIKEVWFPGCHGDIGGGWPAVIDDYEDFSFGRGAWRRIKNFWTTSRAAEPTRDIQNDPFQLSDIPLSWMIREVELVGEKDPSAALKWRPNAESFKERFRRGNHQALAGLMHDSLRFGCGTGFFTVLLWKFMEWFPFITRWELENNEWVNVRFPLNGGSTRDIPTDAVLHESLLWRLRNDPSYRPLNNHGDYLQPCLGDEHSIADVEPVEEKSEALDLDHQTHKFTMAHRRKKAVTW